ncbi:hypothetical protein IFM89_022753 [Coptis chinensis]|uniref:Uncharacterized protein n=1 Tax=Coptis chinensis TaxID=261450 RepID=A0A835HCK1_9MAGN|nr:hypothetical protein IFM89_022753 [Coptis chinensis]
MAEDFGDGEFWLPSEFLTDDDIKKFQKEVNCFPTEFPFSSYGGGGGINSPVESFTSSNETESDEDDYLTREMARSLLHQENPKTRVMAGSPESTLCGLGSWAGSSRGSPNGPSMVSSPPSTPLNGGEDAWDLLYAAAGEVVRMRLNEEGSKFGRGLLAVPQNPTPKNSTANVVFYPNHSNQALAQQQLQLNQFLQLKQQQQQREQISNVWGRQPQVKQTQVSQHQQQLAHGGRALAFGNGRSTRPLGLPQSAWPPLQNQSQNGSGMRAVFLGGSGTRRESSGTGVFLPRRNGVASESRKKPGCSTVLVPARVVQALNLNFDDLGGGVQQQPRFVAGFHGGFGNSHFPQPKRSYRPQPAINTEVQLPQEWTY